MVVVRIAVEAEEGEAISTIASDQIKVLVEAPGMDRVMASTEEGMDRTEDKAIKEVEEPITMEEVIGEEAIVDSGVRQEVDQEVVQEDLARL